MVGARLAGQGVDESWTASDDSAGAARGQVELLAAWIEERISQSRAAGSLEMLCLDADGSVCSWVSSPSRDPRAVAALARLGPASGAQDPNDGGGNTSTNAVLYFAGDALDSSVQPLVDEGEERGTGADPASGRVGLLDRARTGKPKRVEPAVVERLPVLAATEVPARVLIDALDARGVVVNSVTSIWHLLAQAWDPSSALLKAGEAAAETGTDAPTTAVVLIDPIGRVVWSWSVGGTLRAAGSMRLRIDSAGVLTYGRAEAARLWSEWLAWSLQTGLTPRRVVCLAPSELETGHARQFGSALAALSGADGGMAVDIAAHDDPLGATFARIVGSLESTAVPVDSTRPTRGFADLSVRPTRASRRLWIWAALVITAASGLLGVIAWQWRHDAAVLRRQTAAYEIKWKDEVGKVFPDALGLNPKGPKGALEDEIVRRRAELLPAERAEPAMPVMDEFETLSLVLGTGTFSLTALDVAYEAVTITVQAASIEEADALFEALQGVSGSRVATWTPQFDQVNTTGADGKPAQVIRATIRGVWDRSRRAREAGGGGA